MFVVFLVENFILKHKSCWRSVRWAKRAAVNCKSSLLDISNGSFPTEYSRCHILWHRGIATRRRRHFSFSIFFFLLFASPTDFKLHQTLLVSCFRFVLPFFFSSHGNPLTRPCTVFSGACARSDLSSAFLYLFFFHFFIKPE